MDKFKNLEKSACFTGHRPDKLGGYDMNNPTILKLKDKLTEVIRHLIVDEGITRFITGGALGTDQVAFKRVHDLKADYPHIQNILAVPFKDQSAAWPDRSRLLYNKVVELADEVVYVDTLDDYEFDRVPVGAYHAAKMQLRNNYMVDNSRIVIAVYDGTKGGTENCVKYARRKNRAIYTLRPQDDFEYDILYGLV